jgi:hypothetical protein
LTGCDSLRIKIFFAEEISAEGSTLAVQRTSCLNPACDLTEAVVALPDAAFRMWAYAMTHEASPEYWSTDVFREALGFTPAKVSRTANDLIQRGYLRMEAKNIPGRRGRISYWTFLPQAQDVETAAD